MGDLRLRGGIITAVLVAGALPSLAPVADADHGVPSHRVFVITDSVGRGTLPPFSSGLLNAFGPDWDLGGFVAFPALMVHQAEANNVDPKPFGAFGDTAVVALGYSQPASFPYWDPARFDREIDSVIQSFEERGVQQVYWVTLREVTPFNVPSASARREMQPYSWYFPGVNAALRRAVERHDNLTLIDWATFGDRPGLTYDAIHLNTLGVSEYTSLVARTVKAGATRILDGTITPITVAGTSSVPADAAAVALNLAVTNPRRGGFLTAFPCGESVPLAANLNFVADQTVSAAAIVPVGTNGQVCIYNSAATHLIVDVMGSFSAGGGYSRAGPARLADTRGAGQPIGAGQELRVQMPAGVDVATAAVLNVTAIGGPNAGFVTAYRCGDAVPATSNVNFGADAIVPNLVVVAPDATGAVCLRPNQPAHLVVDVFGAFTGTSVQLPGATRAIDTRVTGGAPPAGGGEVQVSTGAVGAAGVFVNVTAVEASATGFLTTYACGAARPPTANLNVDAGQTRGNFAIATPDAAGHVCVFGNVGTNVVVDVMGTVASGFTGLASPVRAFDSRPT